MTEVQSKEVLCTEQLQPKGIALENEQSGMEEKQETKIYICYRQGFWKSNSEALWAVKQLYLYFFVGWFG